MVEHLTQKNGVVCQHCFRTIDLTSLHWTKSSGIYNTVEKMLGTRPLFNVTCPFCKQRATYSRTNDVKPISEDVEKEKMYQKEIEDLRKQVLNGKVEATIMARELKDKSTNIVENESDEQDITLPPEHDHPSTKPKNKIGDPYF